MQPRNFEEKVIWYSIIGTYVFYFTGTLYFVPPILAWVLTFYLLWKLWLQTKDTPTEDRINIPLTTWVWIVSMLMMFVALVGGHLNFNLGLAATIKSSFGWGKGWAMWALLPLIGCLNIRPQIISRAVCILCLQSLILYPVYYAGSLLKLPNPLYTLPFNFFGAPAGTFSISLYLFDANDGKLRIGLFAPWAAAIGYVGTMLFPLTLGESNRVWRGIGMAGSLMMCWISGSRLAVVSVPATWLIAQTLSKISHPVVLFLGSFFSVLAGAFFNTIVEFYQSFFEGFRNLRKGSNIVREALDRIAIERWSEAPIVGHGTVERGPHLVEFMPIGSHNTWTGLLFVKGAVGFAALAVPMLFSFVTLVFKAQSSKTAKIALNIHLVIFLNSFADSLEVTVYIVWMSLIFMGIAFKESQGRDLNLNLETAPASHKTLDTTNSNEISN
ncbi:hypothetical protein [Pseudanabaena sp. PCC 6802]|uniref:hypothetical protein n=1 Tax=Pseudanabaena sp. PCC 6802 TaxID=118173 RepID=UPI00034BD6E2|nr:hypothetical protein [Pseudanabaena sp. PCC 6802]